MNKCIFCKILKGKLPSYKIYEDENTYVFLSIEPASNGHTLVIPKIHIKNVFEVDDETFKNLNKAIKYSATLLKEKMHADGIKIIQNNGYFQDIDHYHVHLIPHYKKENKIGLDKIYDILKGESNVK